MWRPFRFRNCNQASARCSGNIAPQRGVMDKLDLKSLMKPYWSPPRGQFEIIDVPAFSYAMIDGAGDPNTAPAYAEAISWLYSTSYAFKFASKAAGRDYTVAPLQALWWAHDMSDFVARRKERWLWTAMILQPQWITRQQFEAGAAKTAAKLGDAPVSLRLESLHEGLCVQTLHVGSYDDEGPILKALHEEFLPAQGLAEAGKHHEIYLSDARRTAPAKLKTILRQPVRRL